MRKFIIQLIISIFVVCCNSTIERSNASSISHPRLGGESVTALTSQIDTIHDNTLPNALFMH
jgi:hypothetical protein